MKAETFLPEDYRPAEDEPFMNERQAEYFRRKLLAWKEDILEDSRDTVEGLQENTRNIPDVADRASEETDRALELRTRDRQRKLVAKIDSALRRIDEGEYGYCEVTGEPISLKRLDARPIATMSLEAQERHERREKMQNGLNRIDGRIVIIGAGIGGLAAARALALRGAKVTVLEQAPAITEVGAGIQLGPNGTAVMRALGLDQALRDTGTPIGRALVLRNRHGARLARFPMSGLKRPDDYLFVHRAALIQVLEQGARAAGVTIDLGQRITGVRTGTPSDPMAVVETDGKEITAPLVIGADGLHSVTARALGDRGQPFFTGQVAWRATVPEDLSPTAEVELYMAPGRHLVTYPLRGGTLRNIVAVEERSTWTEESWSRHDDPANLRAAFAQMGDRVQDLLARVQTAHIWGLFRHPVAERWHGTGVALMGDAVHPTLPFLAQGASAPARPLSPHCRCGHAQCLGLSPVGAAGPGGTYRNACSGCACAAETHPVLRLAL
eukprot:g18821.t1